MPHRLKCRLSIASFLYYINICNFLIFLSIIFGYETYLKVLLGLAFQIDLLSMLLSPLSTEKSAKQYVRITDCHYMTEKQ